MSNSALKLFFLFRNLDLLEGIVLSHYQINIVVHAMGKDSSAPDKKAKGNQDNLGIIDIFSIKSYFVTHQNYLIKTVLMTGHNVCFC